MHKQIDKFSYKRQIDILVRKYTVCQNTRQTQYHYLLKIISYEIDFMYCHSFKNRFALKQVTNGGGGFAVCKYVIYVLSFPGTGIIEFHIIFVCYRIFKYTEDDYVQYQQNFLRLMRKKETQKSRMKKRTNYSYIADVQLS